MVRKKQVTKRRVYKTNYQKKYRRKRYNRKNKPYVKNIPVVTGIPERLNMKMKYNELITLNSTTANYYQFRLNSLYDPNYSGVGHQPRSYDEWGRFYGRYKVNGCSINVRFINGANTALKIFSHADTDPATLMTYEEAKELPGGATTLMVGSGTLDKFPYMRKYFSIKKICGEKLLDDIYSSQWGTNPNRIVYLTLGAEGLTTPGTLSTPISMDITLTFYVTLFDRIQLPES